MGLDRSILNAVTPPLHLLFFSCLLGASIYQSFVMTKISYRALPKSAFRSLQKQVFPFYFRLQIALTIATAVTIPSHGLLDFTEDKLIWIPHVVALISAMSNIFMFEPFTRKAMIQVTHQETRETLSHRTTDSDEDEEEKAFSTSNNMSRIKKNFSFHHAMCIHLNLLTMGAILAYGWTLAARMK
ncbi:hypothetical protein B0T21DRAFT_297865 [Apiosordaria backusii]|uniref:TMEM205-like domain-containing protein n=1 Tax=Apiosordaria backusii TaxID=314023 RepID=A0AA40DNV7_9PEZI|nr:hypothetical protein B0T21DRAFT_297865 [Apiosordaria backusii]